MIDQLSISGRYWDTQKLIQAGGKDFVSALLQARGINDIESFLHPTMRALMPDPARVHDIDRAAEKFMQTLDQRGGISLLADFDVDGATSAAVLFQYCAFFGVRPLVEVPERLREGFGPNARILDSVAGRGSDLLLCLDCGTAAVSLFAEYRDSLTTIIVDHHQPESRLPDVFAVVNPHVSADGADAFGDLAAVGVVFLLLIKTNQYFRAAGRDVPDLKQFLDLVALGTVCDMAPMRGLNRAFSHRGLELMQNNPSTGLAALLPSRSSQGLQIEDLSFSVGPKLNAGSRMGYSNLSWQLLVETDPNQARSFASRLSALNTRRKKESESLATVANQAMLRLGSVLYASGQDWPLGVLGILAGRLARRWHQPCFIVSFDSEGVGSGSVRSVPGLDIAALLQQAVHLGILERGGGHAMAGGFGLNRAQEQDFLAFLHQQGELNPITPEPRQVDAVLQIRDCSWGFYSALQKLEPFGIGNPEPVFLLEEVKIRNVALMGHEHLRAQIIDDRMDTLNMVLFGEAQSDLGKVVQSSEQQYFDLLIRLKADFRMRAKVTAHLEDARLR